MSTSASTSTDADADDTTPPQTIMSEEFPASGGARFSFDASEPASFTCSLDGAPFSACDSPTVYPELDAGWHTFAVRATDAAGNTDSSPAEIRWHVENGDAVDQ